MMRPASRRDSRGSRVIILFEFGDDQQWRDFRFHRKVAGDEDDRTIFARARARTPARKPVSKRRPKRGKKNAAKYLPAARAETGSGFFHFTVGVFQYGLYASNYERQTDKDKGEGDSERRERHFDPSGSSQRPSQPFGA